MSKIISIRDLKEKIACLPDSENEINLISDDLYKLLNPHSGQNSFKITIGDWSNDGHNQSDEYIYESEVPLAALQNAFKSACREYGLIFDTNNILKVTSKYRHIMNEFEDSSISIDLLKHLDEIGIPVEDLFYYNRKDYENYKQTGVYNPEIKKDAAREEHFASMSDGISSFIELIIAVIRLKLPGVIIKASDYAPTNTRPFNGFWTDNDMNMSLGYGLYSF